MKIFLWTIAILGVLNADEMQRIESIVKDITNLRADYEKCTQQLKENNNTVLVFETSDSVNEEKLKSYELLLIAEKRRNQLLISQIDEFNSSDVKKTDLQKNIERLEVIVKNQEESLKTKEISINSLRKEISSLEKKNKRILLSKDNKAKSLKNKSLGSAITNLVCEKQNSFPELVMKEEIRTQKIIKKKNIKKSVKSKTDIINASDEEIYITDASAFRLLGDSNIYDAIEGVVVDEWEERTSFTSNQKSENWVKITGYFVDKQWLPASENLWIQSSKVLKR